MAVVSPLVDIGRRLPWLLVFRAAVATALLVLTLAADISDSPLARISSLLYVVVIGTFVLVLVLGLLLRSNVSPVIMSAAYLGMALVVPAVVVQATGGVESLFSFLYLLAILDAAIIGGRQPAVGIASACSLIYGAQLVGQLHGFLPAPIDSAPPATAYAVAAVAHIAGFFLVAALAGYLADLAQREREMASNVQDDLERAEELHEEILASLPVGVITFAADGTVLTANQCAARILEQTVTSLVGEGLPPSLQPFSTGEQTYQEAEIEVGGRNRCLIVNRSPVLAGRRQHRALSVLVVEDRTELRDLERDLQAKRRLASLGELSAAIAHEIRNPLAAISGAVELLTTESTNISTRGRLQDIVLREIDRLNQLVGDFLVYARPAPPRRVETDVRAALDDITEVLSRDANWSRYSIKVNSHDSLEARVDPQQVRQVLWNLLRNALEASPVDGTVEVTLARGPESLVLEVRDYGEGISDEVRPFLFEPFRTTRRSGTGLGLAVVHRIVEAHRGTITIDSKPGSGTTVKIVLPESGDDRDEEEAFREDGESAAGGGPIGRAPD